MKKIRIMIVEVNQLIMNGLKSWLEKQNDITVKFSKTIPEAIRTGKDFKPEIILLNPFLPGIPRDSILSVKTLKKEFPSSHIITIDILPDNSKILHYIKSGVSGFILRDASHQVILNTIRNVTSGNKIIPIEMIDALFLQITTEDETAENNIGRIKTVHLTRREEEIINLIAEGMNNKEIANQLHISFNTVKSHVHNLLKKFNFQSRVQLAKYSKKK